MPLSEAERVDRRRASCRESYRRNKEKRIGYQHEYREQNRDKFNDYQRQYRRRRKYTKPDWWKEHPSRELVILKAIERWRRRQHIAKGLEYTLTEPEWLETLEEFDGCCAYCESDDSIEREHVVPMNSGGGYTKFNVVPACDHCNTSKGAKEFLPWYTVQPFFTEARLNKVLNFIAFYSKKLEVPE